MQAQTLHIANWSERNDRRRTYSGEPHTMFLFTFGAYGSTDLLVFGTSLEAALETAAEWLSENAPGHIMAHDSEELTELHREACEEAGLAWPPPDQEGAERLGYFGAGSWQDCHEGEGYYAAVETAEADLTYTESGYLTSYEWGVADYSRAQLRADVVAGRWDAVTVD